MLMLQYSQSSLNELLNSDRHVDHDRHLQSQPTSEGAYAMLSLEIPQILVDRDRHCPLTLAGFASLTLAGSDVGWPSGVGWLCKCLSWSTCLSEFSNSFNEN